MSLTDDPFYRKIVEGNDTPILLGVLGAAGIQGALLAFIEIDYYHQGESMEPYITEAFDSVGRIGLYEKDRTYTIEVGEKSTTLMFAEGETAAHTASNFWAQYTADAPEHEAFQKALKKEGVWMFVIATKKNLRQFLVGADGLVLHKRTQPMTPEIMKAYKIGELP